MKKVKRLLMMAMAAAMVLCAALTPASATVDGDAPIVPFVGNLGDYGYNGSFEVTGTRATAKITVEFDGHGIQLTQISAEVNGEMHDLYNRGTTHKIYTFNEARASTYVSASHSVASSAGYTFTTGYCKFFANGSQVRSYVYNVEVGITIEK